MLAEAARQELDKCLAEIKARIRRKCPDARFRLRPFPESATYSLDVFGSHEDDFAVIELTSSLTLDLLSRTKILLHVLPWPMAQKPPSL